MNIRQNVGNLKKGVSHACPLCNNDCTINKLVHKITIIMKIQNIHQLGKDIVFVVLLSSAIYKLGIFSLLPLSFYDVYTLSVETCLLLYISFIVWSFSYSLSTEPVG